MELTQNEFPTFSSFTAPSPSKEKKKKKKKSKRNSPVLLPLPPPPQILESDSPDYSQKRLPNYKNLQYHRSLSQISYQRATNYIIGFPTKATLFKRKNGELCIAYNPSRYLLSEKDNQRSPYKEWKSILKLPPVQRLIPKTKEHSFRDSTDYSKEPDSNLHQRVEVEELEESNLSFIKVPEFLDVDQSEMQANIGSEEYKLFSKKVSEINQLLKKDPKNISLWKKYLNAADILPSKSTAQFHSRLQKKMGIIEQALKELPDCEDLLVEKLRTGEELWDVPKILTQYEMELSDYPNYVELWMGFINFKMSNLNDFTVFSCTESFEECFRVLKQECDELSGIGYTERGMAVLQSNIEFNLFTPTAYKSMPLAQRIEMFEVFWDTECDRVGENKSKGWMNSLLDVAATNADMEVDETSAKDNDMEMSNDQYLNWYNSEIKLDLKNFFPTKTILDDGNDPFRIPLFHDISPFLVDISDELKPKLLFMYLQVLGIPISSFKHNQYLPDPTLHYQQPDTSASSGEKLSSDSYSASFGMLPSTLNNDTFQRLFARIGNLDGGGVESEQFKEGKPQVGEENEEDRRERRYVEIVSNRPWSFDYMMEVVGMQMVENIEKYSGGIESICNVLKQTKALSEETLLPGLEFCLDVLTCTKSVSKIAKAHLKNDQHNLILWNLFACFEYKNGRVEEARKIFITSTQSGFAYLKDTTRDNHDIYLLFRKYCEMEFDLRNNELCLYILTCVAEQVSCDVAVLNGKSTTISSTSKPRARKNYQNLIDTTDNSTPIFIEILRCFTLFEYLSTQSIEPASQIFESVIAKFPPTTKLLANQLTALEQIYESFILLVYNYTSGSQLSSSYKPAVLQNILVRAIEIFPENTLMWKIYSCVEWRFGLEHRMRRVLENMIERTSKLECYIILLQFELSQLNPNTNYVSTILKESTTKFPHSEVLWIFYLNFEHFLYTKRHHQSKSKKKKKASEKDGYWDGVKSVVYDAMRNCPWSKKIYMLGIEKFLESGGDDDEDEVGEILAVMEEKEIRMRNELPT
ncbi:hypothetical protein HK098_006057 [Nowakowskiella sp. JEL0407]|nr:hypothetical protein HK098_006057 [Nowakowskiella sp. JEL0407]